MPLSRERRESDRHVVTVNQELLKELGANVTNRLYEAKSKA